MDEVYKKIKKEVMEGKFLREIASKIPDVEKANEIRQQQDKLYKKTMFKKHFLEARSELSGRTK